MPSVSFMCISVSVNGFGKHLALGIYTCYDVQCNMYMYMCSALRIKETLGTRL